VGLSIKLLAAIYYPFIPHPFLRISPGGCPRIAIAARAKLVERDFSII
jgi:hypothetical protein